MIAVLDINAFQVIVAVLHPTQDIMMPVALEILTINALQVLVVVLHIMREHTAFVALQYLRNVIVVIIIVQHPQLVVLRLMLVHMTLVAPAHTMLVSLQRHAALVTPKVLTTLVRQTPVAQAQIIAHQTPAARVPTIAHQTTAAHKQQITVPHMTGFLRLLNLYLEPLALLLATFLQQHIQTQMELKELKSPQVARAYLLKATATMH
jgi:hypothetical protein